MSHYLKPTKYSCSTLVLIKCIAPHSLSELCTVLLTQHSNCGHIFPWLKPPLIQALALISWCHRTSLCDRRHYRISFFMAGHLSYPISFPFFVESKFILHFEYWFPSFFLLLPSLVSSFDTLMVVYLIKDRLKGKKITIHSLSVLLTPFMKMNKLLASIELIFRETFSGEDKVLRPFPVMCSKVVKYL